MADIRVTCPSCKSQLEIGAEFEGQEVECGTCLEVFVASTKKAKPKTDDADEDDKPASKSGSGKSRGSASSSGRGKSKTSASRKRDDDDDDDDDDDRGRRRRDDDDDDDDDDRPRRSGEGPGAVSIVALVLGVLSTVAFPLTCCGCCSIFSWPITIPLALSAIITGAFGLKDPKGKVLSIVGMVLGGISLCFIMVQMFVGFGPIMVQPPAGR